MVGDIKLATLSDTDTTNAEYVTGGYGNFTDARLDCRTGWTLQVMLQQKLVALHTII